MPLILLKHIFEKLSHTKFDCFYFSQQKVMVDWNSKLSAEVPGSWPEIVITFSWKLHTTKLAATEFFKLSNVHATIFSLHRGDYTFFFSNSLTTPSNCSQNTSMFLLSLNTKLIISIKTSSVINTRQVRNAGDEQLTKRQCPRLSLIHNSVAPVVPYDGEIVWFNRILLMRKRSKWCSMFQ